MSVPDDRKYTKDHEWVKIEDGVAVMGITEFAQSELGDLVFVELPAIGKSVKQKDSICVVESTKAASDVYAPVGGTVKEVNITLSEKPELVNSDPYGSAWLVKLGQVNEGDLGNLMSADDYKKHIGQ